MNKKNQIGSIIEGVIMLCFSLLLVVIAIWCIVFTIKSFIKPKDTVQQIITNDVTPVVNNSKNKNSPKINITVENDTVVTTNDTIDDISNDDIDNMCNLINEKGIWIGDSRTVGIKNAIIDGTYIAEKSMGYSWLISDVIPKLEKLLEEDPDKIIIINFGVNDLDNIKKYVETINELVVTYKDTKFYYLSVNPVAEPYADANTMNSEINDFNDTIIRSCAASYIDSNTYLNENGFESSDGLHYSNATNENIYNFVIKELAKNL